MLRWMDLCRRGMLAFQSRNEDIQMNRAQPDTEMKRSGIEVGIARKAQNHHTSTGFNLIYI